MSRQSIYGGGIKDDPRAVQYLRASLSPAGLIPLLDTGLIRISRDKSDPAKSLKT